MNTPEPEDLELDSEETQESRFLDQHDWGPQRTSKEMKDLQDTCMRLQKALSTTLADNRTLGEKLQNLPTTLYQKLKDGMQAKQEDVKGTQSKPPSRKGAVPFRALGL